MMPELDCDFFTKHLYLLKGTETIYTGPYLEYDNYGAEGQKRKVLGNIEKGKRDGLWRDYDTEGNLLWEYTYKNGEFHGNSISYHLNGQIRCKGYFKNGYQDGLWEWFDKEGRLTKSVSHVASKNKEKQRTERRDLGDEIIQIMNCDLKAKMFEIDRKDFESREAFFNADIKVRKKYYKAGYSYNPYVQLPKDNAGQIMSLLSRSVRSKSSLWFQSHPLTTLRIVLFGTVRRSDLNGGLVYGYEGPSDDDFVFGAELMLHIKERIEKGTY